MLTGFLSENYLVEGVLQEFERRSQSYVHANLPNQFGTGINAKLLHRNKTIINHGQVI